MKLEKDLKPHEYFLYMKKFFIRESEGFKSKDEQRTSIIIDDFDKYIQLIEFYSKMQELTPTNKYYKKINDSIVNSFLLSFDESNKRFNSYECFETFLSKPNKFYDDIENQAVSFFNTFRNEMIEIIQHIEDYKVLLDFKLKLYLESEKIKEILGIDKVTQLEQIIYIIHEQQEFLKFEKGNIKLIEKKQEITEHPFSSDENFRLFIYLNQWFKPRGVKAKFTYILEHFQNVREKNMLESTFFDFIETYTKTRIAKRKQPSANNPDYFEILKILEEAFLK